MFSEIANVTWKRIVIFNHDKEAVLRSLKKRLNFINTMCRIWKSQELIEDALNIAISYKIAVYDALYLALAKRLNAMFLTKI